MEKKVLLSEKAILKCAELLDETRNSKELFNETNVLLDSLLFTKVDVREHCKRLIAKLEDDCLSTENVLHGIQKVTSNQFQMELTDLRAKKSKHEINVMQGKTVLEEITNKKVKVLKSKNIICEKQETLREKETEDVVRDRATFALLTSTCNIRWDYQCPKNEVKGCISGKKDLIPFSINKEQHDTFYTANYIWDLLELSQ